MHSHQLLIHSTEADKQASLMTFALHLKRCTKIVTCGVLCKTGSVLCKIVDVLCKTGGALCKTCGVLCKTCGVLCKTWCTEHTHRGVNKVGTHP